MSIGYVRCGQIAALVLGTAVWGNLAAAFADSASERLQGHLRAGEFPAARALAQEFAPAERDAALSQLAAAQLKAGARVGWATTLGEIGNESLRSGSLSDGSYVARQSPGAAPQPRGNQGGAAQADFKSLIDLIQKTTGMPKPGWVDDGGVGTVEPFRGGVYVDAAGMIHKSLQANDDTLDAVRDLAKATTGNRDVRKQSGLRKISLTRLERELQTRRALGESAEESMRNLAGISRIQYLLVYPDSGDIVLAGPASGWRYDGEGRPLSLADNRPVLQLDDLIVLLRHTFSQQKQPTLGCSIDPRPENLERLQAFLSQSTSPLKAGQRDAWVSKIRELAGTQDIRVFGLDPTTRVAQILVEADYRMKLIGMGLEEGTPGVYSYLDSVRVDENGIVPPMTVLRWWFTMNYEAIKASKSQDAFALQGQGVKVLSENQLLAEQGRRVATGTSDDLNTKFAESFTSHFDELAAKYPIYAELQNVFDLALISALLQAQDLPGQVGWQMAFFGNPELCSIATRIAPKEVTSVVNHRVIARKHVVAGVSGGVSADARQYVLPGRLANDGGSLNSERIGSAPKGLPENGWWWD